MGLKEALLYRTFGRPRGLLGRLGGRLMTGRDKREMAEWVLSGLAVEPTDRVLEVGFGPGIGIQTAADAAPEGLVAGVDYSREMVEMARTRNAEAVDAGRVDLRYGPADDLPFDDAAFNAAFSINSMQVWPDAAAGLQEIRRVLHPGGRLALGFTPIAGQSSGELRPLLERAGFDDVRVEEGELGTRAFATK
ncbi:methyltransferase domain-containing protein [Halorarum halophilum]|uniref:Methyltransferase domain-containing protein n=1 Tax=Halorarum halophilum TaxID=2743090 RepID=A0A7D5GJG2_9EURY|nr:methyltransferase domain-containing protein [Halobaculum halophilum]QLG28871.1 methyltransferase domain-containing protein [Halobaculum halophilum]